MATATGCAELTVVRIVLGVAAFTILRDQWPLAAYGLTVAGKAIQPRMRPLQREPGLPIMVEFPDPPAVRRMTLLTESTQLQLVYILVAMTADTFHPGIGIARTAMAFPARHHLVQADQRKSRQPMIQLDTRTPSLCSMALVTLPALAAPVLIVEPMACITLPAGLYFKQLLFMAVRAIGLGMPAGQRKPGLPVMRKRDFGPFFRTVTLTALVTKITMVLVVCLVACHTGCCELFITWIVYMAIFAAKPLVPAGQRKIRFPVMIEQQPVPGLRGMTGFTIPAQLALVHIIELMAGHAPPWCMLITCVGMAAFAVDFLMLAAQFEPGLVMIETGRFPPSLVVTPLALPAEALLMRIILPVTGITCYCCIAVFFPWAMTGLALQAAMPAT